MKKRPRTLPRPRAALPGRKRKHPASVKRKRAKAKMTTRVRKVIIPAKPAEGFALIHKTDGSISLASVRSNERMVVSLAATFEALRASHNYRVGRVKVMELVS